MAYFSRLTDIVTCNLTRLLEEADDPQAALQEIIREMESGLAVARRSMTTAESNESRIQTEVDEHAQQIAHWTDQARREVATGNEDRARLALMRKREADDLVASLKEELAAARETREHLTRTFRALEARLAEARRRETAGCDDDAGAGAEQSEEASARIDDSIEDELAALKRELGQG
jgi:phage shock protein A